jgi:hypothetical protein
MTSQGVGIELSKLHCNNMKVLCLETRGDHTDELPLNRIGLQEDKCAIRHG